MSHATRDDELYQTSYSADVKPFWLVDVIFDMTAIHKMVLT
jgi:hypothetical protein